MNRILVCLLAASAFGSAHAFDFNAARNRVITFLSPSIPVVVTGPVATGTPVVATPGSCSASAGGTSSSATGGSSASASSSSSTSASGVCTTATTLQLRP